MRAYVFTDAALAKHAGRFVWLSIDTEKEQNADFLKRYPIAVWPTLLVIEPEDERVVLRWPGSADVAKLGALFDEGQQAFARARWGSTAPPVVEDRADRTPLVEKDVLTALMAHDFEKCTQAALADASKLRRGTSFANIAASGLYCAEAADKSAPWRAAALSKLEAMATEALALPGLLADDRSGVYEVLVEAREEAGDAAATKALALKWLAFLEGEAARAPTVEARAAFDSHRVVAAIKAGDPARSIPALVESEKDLPADYNAPARLAVLYKALGRYDDALAAIDRALAKVYGPRRNRLLQVKQQILDARADAK